MAQISTNYSKDILFQSKLNKFLNPAKLNLSNI